MTKAKTKSRRVWLLPFGIGDTTHPYWDRLHPEHKSAVARMQDLFAIKARPVNETTGFEPIEINGMQVFVGAPVAAEIRRLRDRVVNLEQFIEGASNRIEALTNATKRGYRAGIEAAARHLAATTSTRHMADEVRALADQPVPDERLPGLEHIKRAMEAGECVGLDWINREIAAR